MQVFWCFFLQICIMNVVFLDVFECPFLEFVHANCFLSIFLILAQLHWFVCFLLTAKICSQFGFWMVSQIYDKNLQFSYFLMIFWNLGMHTPTDENLSFLRENDILVFKYTYKLQSFSRFVLQFHITNAVFLDVFEGLSLFCAFFCL